MNKSQLTEIENALSDCRKNAQDFIDAISPALSNIAAIFNDAGAALASAFSVWHGSARDSLYPNSRRRMSKSERTHIRRKKQAARRK